jgi:pyruvate dehydrogenase E2 component (dihydrolipoamide acetyltransferase)
MHKIYVPRIDPAIETAKIHWEKKEGDEVEKDEVLLIAEGEKTTFEVQSPTKGILHKILYPSETDVAVGEVIGIIREPGETIKEGFESIEKIKEKVEKKPEASVETEEQRKISEVIQLTGIRKTIAERLSYTQKTTPTAKLILEVNMESLIKLRNELNEKHSKKLSFTAFIAKAIAKALSKHTLLNSTLKDEKIIVFEDINISIAIDTPSGLVTPAVLNTDKKSITQISDEIVELAEKARSNELELKELVSGTFTVTNLGGFDVQTFIPLINPPQAAIIGVGKTVMKPVVFDEDIVIKPIAALTLVFDHRIVDGVPASKFLKEIKEILENPKTMES